jgi:hypothetical protein
LTFEHDWIHIPQENEIEQLIDNVETLLAKVDEQLKQRVTETWEACFESATDAGYGFLFYQTIKRKMRPRNPPALSYDDNFKQACAFVENMLASRAAQKWDPDYQSDLRLLFEEDPSRYTYFLAHAVLFAAEGSWHVASVLAERALEIADSGKHRHISGREAVYMQAVAMRHNAKRITDLVDVAPRLDDAQIRLNREREERPDLDAGEVRFKAEWLSLYLTYHQFHLFQHQTIPQDQEVPPLADVQEAIENLLGRMGTNEVKSLIVLNVERQLLNNFFMIALLRWGKLNEPLDPLALRPMFKRFSDNIESKDEPTIDISFHVKALYLAAQWWTSADSKEKKHARKELENLLYSDIDEYIVFPYGRQRFEFLLRLATGKQ